MTASHYTQAELRHPDDDGGERVHVAFLPSVMAKAGRRLRIDGMPGTWTVTARYETKPAEWIEPKSRDHLHQREASDV